jgi:hypothetical protein
MGLAVWVTERLATSVTVHRLRGHTPTTTRYRFGAPRMVVCSCGDRWPA